MRNLLDDMDPLFMGAAVMIAGLTLASSMPTPPVFLKHPELDFSSRKIQALSPSEPLKWCSLCGTSPPPVRLS